MSEIKYGYQKLMQEHNLTVEQLPEEAKIGITAIRDIEKAISMLEKRGKEVSPKTLAKIKANDKWIMAEIMDFVEETDDNDDDIPYDKQDIIEDIKPEQNEEDEKEEEEEESEEEESDAELGSLIESELEQLFATGISQFKAVDLKKYKNTYNTIYENYEQNGENGVETTKFILVETEEDVYSLKQK